MLVLAITDLRHLFSKAATVAALMKVEATLL
jgi:hypothetical protein